MERDSVDSLYSKLVRLCHSLCWFRHSVYSLSTLYRENSDKYNLLSFHREDREILAIILLLRENRERDAVYFLFFCMKRGVIIFLSLRREENNRDNREWHCLFSLHKACQTLSFIASVQTLCLFSFQFV